MDTLSKGYRVEIGRGSVVLVDIKTDVMKEFSSLAEAYAWISQAGKAA